MADPRRLEQLEDENRRSKALVAGQVMDIRLLKEIDAKKW